MSYGIKRVLLGALVFFICTVFWVETLIAQNSVFGSAQKNPFILEGAIYYLPEGTSKLPNFSSLSPVGKIYTPILNIKPRHFSQGFPGVTDRFEWFAIRYTGKMYVPTTKNYTFSLLSDDGAKLIIDRKVVINNDGIHPPYEKKGTIFLNRGIHSIEVQYFQGPRWEVALVLSIIENGKKHVFDIRRFSPVVMEENKCSVKLTMASGILFDFNKYNLKPKARTVLDSVIDFLKTYKYTQLIVEGHTDNVGSEGYNLELSKKRANSVAKYLVRKGIPKTKIKTVGYGESKPRYPNDTELNRAKNRRVEIKVIKPCN